MLQSQCNLNLKTTLHNLISEKPRYVFQGQLGTLQETKGAKRAGLLWRMRSFLRGGTTTILKSTCQHGLIPFINGI